MAPIDVSRDYYAILEVSRMATHDTIKASYRRLALLHHPDKNGGARSVKIKTQLMSEEAIFWQISETTDS
jgi:curved DNA-binding protein CbpA